MKAIEIVKEAVTLSLEVLQETLQISAKTKVKESVTEKAFCWVATAFRIFT